MNILRQFSIKLWVLIFLVSLINCINHFYAHYLLFFVKWAHNSVGNPLSGEFYFAVNINFIMILLSVVLIVAFGIFIIITFNRRAVHPISILRNEIITYLVLSLLLLFSYISLISSISASITNGQIYRVNGILMNTVATKE